MQLDNFDIAAFLRDHWQKRPLLIRRGFATWTNPLEPDELAGLACDEEVESRIVSRADDGWVLEHGPFVESRFATLGPQPWTLLVQGVDRVVPEVAALIAPFRFVPDWRIDDVMISYAVDAAGVGPHFDQYDVFLIQGLGRRRWRVGPVCDAATSLLPHADLRLLATFEAEEEWVLEPGDVLYLPPGYAHDGEAIGDDCMTYSIGFRAPSTGELIDGWCDHLAETLPDDLRYTDPDLVAQDNPAEISDAAIARLHTMVTDALHDRAGFARWFGQHTTAPKFADIDLRPEEDIGTEMLHHHLATGAELWRNPGSRFAFIRHDDATITLFVDGEAIDCGTDTAAFVETLCAHDRIGLDPDAVDHAVLALAVDLVNRGSVLIDDDDCPIDDDD